MLLTVHLGARANFVATSAMPLDVQNLAIVGTPKLVAAPSALHRSVRLTVKELAADIIATETDAPRSVTACNVDNSAKGQGVQRIVWELTAGESAPDIYAPKGDAIRKMTLFRVIYGAAITPLSTNARRSPKKQVLIVRGT